MLPEAKDTWQNKEMICGWSGECVDLITFLWRLIKLLFPFVIGFALAILSWGFFFRNEPDDPPPDNWFIGLWILCCMFVMYVMNLISDKIL